MKSTIVKSKWFRRQIRDAFIRGMVVAENFPNRIDSSSFLDEYFNETYKKEGELNDRKKSD